MKTTSDDFVILGGGVAGLTMARELLRCGRSVTVLERASWFGGLARTFEREGFRFDIGGHRFHSNNPDVVNWVRELLGDQLLEVGRSSRIYMGGRFVDYPIQFPGALTIFSPAQAVKVGLSYLSTFVRPGGEDVSFEDWVVRRFGHALFDTYFRPYTEKVWGISCTELSADWASARISIPSLWQTFAHAIHPPKNAPKTAIRRFYYPRDGFGTICDRLIEEIDRMGGRLQAEAEVLAVRPGPRDASVTFRCGNGEDETITTGTVVSTIPIEALLGVLPPESNAAEVARSFHLDYRGIVLLCLAINRKQVTPDQWTYFPGPETIFGRSHEPKNWSAAMVPSQQVTSLALEIYASPGDAAWTSTDADLVAHSVDDLARLGLMKTNELLHGWVLRVPYAYPIYRIGYAERMKSVRNFLEASPTLRLLGRTGAFHYMNSDGVVEDCLRVLHEIMPEREQAIRPLEAAARWA